MKEKKQTQKNKNRNKNCTRTYIGGQAVMEGIMMRGKTAMATAVRDPDGEIQIESEYLPSNETQNKFFRLPLVRGVVNFIHSLVDGNKVLMRSADVALSEEEEEETKAEKWLREEKKVNREYPKKRKEITNELCQKHLKNNFYFWLWKQ